MAHRKKKDTQLFQLIILIVLLLSMAVGLMLVNQNQVFRLKAEQEVSTPY